MRAVARIVWNDDYLQEYWMNYVRYVQQGRMRAIASVCLLVSAMVAWPLSVRSTAQLVTLEVGTVLAALAYLSYARKAGPNFLDSIRKSPIYGQSSEIIFEEDRIVISEPAIRNECKWEACQRVIELPASMFVFLSGAVFYIPDETLSPREAKPAIIERIGTRLNA